MLLLALVELAMPGCRLPNQRDQSRYREEFAAYAYLSRYTLGFPLGLRFPQDTIQLKL